MRITIGIIIILFTARVASADDPGIPDTIIVGTVYAEVGQPFVDVPVSTVTDDSVFFYFMPLKWSLESEGIVPSVVFYYYPLTFWNDLQDTILVDEHYLWMIGWGDAPHFLNTGGSRWHCWDIRFTIENMAAPQVVVVDSGYDPVNGSIIYGLIGGVEAFMPQIIPGAIYYGIPTPVSGGDPPLPADISYLNNYPNPFNGFTTLEFTLPEEADVELAVYNILGQKIALLLDGRKPAGKHSVAWDAGDLPSGVYFARLEAKSGIKNIKMILLK